MTVKCSFGSTLTLLAVLSTTALVGCGKKYGAGCEKAAELSAPWTELGLPVEGNTRVCSSSSDELKLRSWEWDTKEEAQTALETAILAAGYSKDRCTGQACYYDKDGYTVSVQPIDFKMDKKNLQTVVMRHQKDRTSKK